MKQTRLIKFLAAGSASVLALSTVMAQESSTTTATTVAGGTAVTTSSTSTLNGTGVITEYTPNSEYITFRSESAAPVKYYYTKKTVLVDPEGRTVEWSALRPDMPVNYTYVREGDRMVVTKVTLQKPVVVEKKETTTTTTTTHKH